MQKNILPLTNDLIFTNQELSNIIDSKFLELKQKQLATIHKQNVTKEIERINKIKAELEIQKQVNLATIKKN